MALHLARRAIAPRDSQGGFGRTAERDLAAPAWAAPNGGVRLRRQMLYIFKTKMRRLSC